VAVLAAGLTLWIVAQIGTANSPMARGVRARDARAASNNGGASTAPAPVPRGVASQRLTQFLLVALVLLVGTLVVLLAWDRSSGSSSTVQGSGVSASQARSLPPFSSIHLAGSNRVTVYVGGEQSVVVHADDNLIEHVTTNVRDGALVVSETGSYATTSPMAVDVTVPELDSVTLSGSGILGVEGVSSRAFVVRAPGSGIIKASGTANALDASLDGSGDVQLQDLLAQDARASVSGSGRMQVHATRTLVASISGSGAIFYTGGPQVTQSISGSGVVIGR
jgi:Putative auto-transporter adhesin, head GIN domain